MAGGLEYGARHVVVSTQHLCVEVVAAGRHSTGGENSVDPDVDSRSAHGASVSVAVVRRAATSTGHLPKVRLRPNRPTRRSSMPRMRESALTQKRQTLRPMEEDV